MTEQNEAQILKFNPAGDDDSSSADLRENLRMVEAIVFASSEPVSQKALKERLPEGADLDLVMSELQQVYATRGVNLVKIGNNWAFRTADDLSFLTAKRNR